MRQLLEFVTAKQEMSFWCTQYTHLDLKGVMLVVNGITGLLDLKFFLILPFNDFLLSELEVSNACA